MTKNKASASILLIVSLAIFNVIFFLIPCTKDASFWVSYIFGMVAILSQLLICVIAWNKATTMKSKFMGVPIIVVGNRFLVIQLISSFVFFALCVFSITIPFFIPLIINIIILGAVTFYITAIDTSRDEINRIDEKVATKVNYVKSLQVDVEMLIARTSDENTKKSLQNLAEKIRYSDPMSNASLQELENTIKIKIEDLKNNISENEINEIGLLIEERNKKALLLK